ncbi:hypothetical protein [Vibrio mediterranei]|uniref:hypothetical protein n=1 Tax=Vibrio mediterranei TaxID=689 RepID=UPI0022843832|nr:hypothetical protein [Vibrio mediterranei]MCY9855428.1 hypothetical protein [Vibrio mediterranei]
MDIKTAAKRFPIGTKIKYFPLANVRSSFHVGEVRSEPWEVCGEVVVAITGKAGGLSVDHLEVMAYGN